MIEEHRAIFEGRETTFIGWFKEVNNTIFTRVPHKWFPFIKTWRPILSNVKHYMNKGYQERKIIDLNKGRTGVRIRVYPFDLDTFTPYFPMMNDADKRLLESLTVERDFLFSIAKEMEQIIKTAGMEDKLKGKFKDDYNFFTSLKPPYVIDKHEDKKKKKTTSG